jgi:hypothetical protein
MFASDGPFDEGDEVGQLLESFRERIDERCRPLIDLEYAKIDRVLGIRLGKPKEPRNGAPRGK